MQKFSALNCSFFVHPKVLESSEDDDKAVTTMGILNTLETILAVMEDKEIHSKLEPIVLQV
jgi:hypothetical protein